MKISRREEIKRDLLALRDKNYLGTSWEWYWDYAAGVLENDEKQGTPWPSKVARNRKNETIQN